MENWAATLTDRGACRGDGNDTGRLGRRNARQRLRQPRCAKGMRPKPRPRNAVMPLLASANIHV